MCLLQVITSIDTARLAALQKEGIGRAKYNFNAQTSVELPLRKVTISTISFVKVDFCSKIKKENLNKGIIS